MHSIRRLRTTFDSDLLDVGLTRKALDVGVADAAGLAWLNQSGGAVKARLRVARFIQLLRTADEAAARLSKMRYFSQTDNISAEEDEINKILARYHGSRRIVWWDFKPKVGFWPTNWERGLRDNSYAAESSLVAYALSLLEDGRIQRLKTCAECGKWFYATKPNAKDHNFCTTNCRQRSASHTDRYKKKKREYQRKYRVAEKELERKSRERLRQR